MSTKVEASISAPLPAVGSMAFSETARVTLTLEIDLAGELARALITRKVPDFSELTQQTVNALMVALAQKAGHVVPQALSDAVSGTKH